MQMGLNEHAEGNLKQLLAYITQLVHKVLDMNIKLVNSLKTGLINILSHQKLLIEKINRLDFIEKKIEEVSQYQQTLYNINSTILNEIRNQKLTLENYHNKTAGAIKEKIASTESNIIQNMDKISLASNRQLINLINKQFEHDSQEKLESIKGVADVKKEKIKMRAGIWAAIIMGLLGSGGVVLFILQKLLGG